MDKITYAICKKLVEDAGMVDVAELKADVDELYSLLTGKVYTVTDEGNAQYVFDGTDFIKLNSQAITNAQIDILFN